MVSRLPAGQSSEITIAKSRMREDCKAARARLSLDKRRRAAQRIADIGIGFAGPPKGSAVSAYRAIGDELDPAPLITRLAADGRRTCLPVLQPRGQPLFFRAWTTGEPLVSRMWGIEEPLPGACEIVPVVLLVPLLAFDAEGHRLGYGGGYYDRTLACLRSQRPTIAIGLAFDEQEAPLVPHEPFDEKLDWVLTPTGARCFPK